ncbi:MAG: thioesterase family protein [Gordonia sp. (in: high G+C Gram-positive bacteria)]
MDSAYYLPRSRPDDAPDFEYFRPTDATGGPWVPGIQHGGPPTGLLTRALRRAATTLPGPMQFTRITVEILGPVGLDVNRVRAQVIRPGRRIAMVAADLEVRGPDGTFRPAARAVAWLMRPADTTAIVRVPVEPLTPTPDALTTTPGVSQGGVRWEPTGFIGSLTSAVVPGATGVPAMWLRPEIDLVDGEPITDLESIMTVVDVANGLGTQLDTSAWTWMNTDTTVHFTTVPQGPWLGIDAELAAGPSGFGTTFADLYDARGFIGRSAQTALLDRR